MPSGDPGEEQLLPLLLFGLLLAPGLMISVSAEPKAAA
jgi:hypothetical protein